MARTPKRPNADMDANDHTANASVTKKEWNDAKSQILNRLSTMEQKMEEESKGTRIRFAIEQVNLEIAHGSRPGQLCVVEIGDGRNASDIRAILLSFLQGKGRSLCSGTGNRNYNSDVKKELTLLLGVEPRLVQEKDSKGEIQWTIYYS